MQKNPLLDLVAETELLENPAALSSRYLRSLEASLSQISDFDAFMSSLFKLIGEDPYLDGNAAIQSASDDVYLPDFDSLEPDETIFPITGSAGNYGYLKYRGRADAKPFEASDLHLIGSISSLLATLAYQAQKFKNMEQSGKVLQYLFDQLPLPVACIGEDNQWLLTNTLAETLLDRESQSFINSQLPELKQKDTALSNFHFESQGKLIYAEVRRIQIDTDTSVAAVVFYDLSRSRDQLLLELEKEIYKSDSRGTPFSFALIADHSQPGAIYQQMDAALTQMNHHKKQLYSCDAYTCAYFMQSSTMRSARLQLSELLGQRDLARSLKACICVEETEAPKANRPAEAYLKKITTKLQDLETVLKPVVMVVSESPGIIETFQVILSDIATVIGSHYTSELLARIQSGEINTVFVDLDAIQKAALDQIKEAQPNDQMPLPLHFLTYKQPNMILSEYGLSSTDSILQKPFNADYIRQQGFASLNLLEK